MKRFLSICVCFILCLPFIKADALSAKSAIVLNGDTKEVIFEENSTAQLPMASTTKIMTALLLCENGNLDKEITVTAEMLRVEGSSMGLLAGDKVTLRDLLYGMMLASGNDAANVTAYVLGGTVDGFVKKMNQKAEELGLLNTHFDTPSGLDGETHYTTAYDLGLLACYAMQNEEFYKAASSESATLCYGNPPYKRTLTNHNKLLKTFDGAVGVKTGFTKKSGRCLVSAAKRDGKFVIAVTLCDPNDWQDHKTLLNLGLHSLSVTEIEPEKESYPLTVIGGEENIDILSTSQDDFIEDNFDEDTQITLEDARKIVEDIEVGETIDTEVKIIPESFGRVAALSAKQIIVQKVKEAEKNALLNAFLDAVCTASKIGICMLTISA